MLLAMAVMLRYRGREVTEREVDFLRDLIAAHPGAARSALSRRVCEAWGWRQPNGQLRDMVCRGLMLALHRAGHIELPPPRQNRANPLGCKGAERKRPSTEEAKALDSSPIQSRLSELQPLCFRQVRRTAEEGLVNGMIEAYHYLGYVQPVGEHLKFLVRAREGRPVACFIWSSAPRHLGPRDRHIGWSPEVRRVNLRLVAYNTRYLILPWVKVPHLASHLLGRMTRMLPMEWERVYGHPVHFAETFVDPERYRGTCYLAANWVLLGRTTGRGKNAPTWRPTRSIKEVWGYAMTKGFRERLMRE
jgi:hypothetical protein